MPSPPGRRRQTVAARFLASALLVAVIPLAAACRDVSAPPVELPFTTAELGIFMPALQDARTRIVPALEDKAMAHRVDVQLKGLADNLGTRNVEQARRATNQAVLVLDSYMKSPDAVTTDIPDVGAIQLVLYHAGALLRIQIDPALLPYIGVATGSVDP